MLPEYSDEEERRLAEQLQSLHDEIELGRHVHRAPSTPYLRELHRALFLDVREHAGRIRNNHFGTEYLMFGPNRSVHRSQVPTELEACFEQVIRSVRSAEDSGGETESYEQDVLHIAVWAHAEVVRIHPFQDGNGRTSRLLLDSILVRLGLNPVPIETAKQTYCDCLNVYFARRDIAPLLDLYVDLAVHSM